MRGRRSATARSMISASASTEARIRGHTGHPNSMMMASKGVVSSAAREKREA